MFCWWQYEFWFEEKYLLSHIFWSKWYSLAIIMGIPVYRIAALWNSCLSQRWVKEFMSMTVTFLGLLKYNCACGRALPLHQGTEALGCKSTPRCLSHKIASLSDSTFASKEHLYQPNSKVNTTSKILINCPPNQSILETSFASHIFIWHICYIKM